MVWYSNPKMERQLSYNIWTFLICCQLHSLIYVFHLLICFAINCRVGSRRAHTRNVLRYSQAMQWILKSHYYYDGSSQSLSSAVQSACHQVFILQAEPKTETALYKNTIVLLLREHIVFAAHEWRYGLLKLKYR